VGTTGVIQAKALIEDIEHLDVERQQHYWQETYTVETTTKTKNSFGHSKKKSHSESHTVILKESYPAHLSGLLAFEKFISAQEDATALFPERKEGREMESLRIYGGGVKAGPEGWRHKVKGEIEVRSKEETSLAPFAIRYKGHSKQGMRLVHSPQQPFIEVPQKDLSLTAQMIHLEGAVLKVPQGKVLLEALQELWIESAKVIEHLAPSYYQAKGKIHEVGGWQERFSSPLIEALGVILKAPKIKGHYPQASCSIQYDTLSNTLTHPISQQELYDIVVGQVSKGNAGFATVLALAAAIGSACLATPAAMAAFLGVAETHIAGTIASAMVASLASQTASSLVMHQGNIKQVGKELTSSSFARSLVVTAATAGIMHKLSGALNLPTQPKGFEQHLQVSMVRAAVSTPLNIFIGGSKPGEAVVTGLKCFVANTAGGFISENIGDAFADHKIEELTRYIAHGGGGALTGLLLNVGEGDILKGMATGAVAAMTAEVASDLFSQGLKDQEQSLIEKAKREGRSLSLRELADFKDNLQLRADMAKVVGAMSSLLVGRDVNTAIFAAHNAVEYNYAQHVLLTLAAADVMLELYTLTHPEEAEAYKQRMIQVVAEKIGFTPEAIEHSFKGLMMAGSFAGRGTSKFLKGLGTSLLKSEVGKRLQGIFKGPSLRNGEVSYHSKYWTKTQTYTFNRQTNKVYKRDDLIDLSKKDPFGNTNADLMRRGNAPIGSDGKPINLHHTIQTQDSPLAEISGSMHSKNHAVLHLWSNGSRREITRVEVKPNIDRAQFKKWKTEYWKERLKELEGTK
jgi:hypothetical protein